MGHWIRSMVQLATLERRNEGGDGGFVVNVIDGDIHTSDERNRPTR